MIRETLKTMEAAVRRLSDLNTALDEALIVAITDVRGNITFANKKFCEISKYSQDELIGQNHRIINSGHHSKEFFRSMWRTIARGNIWTGEIKNKAKDGTFYWMHTIIVPLLTEEGKPYQYVSFRNEITTRKLEEEKLGKLMATMPDVVLFQDGDGRWLQANDAALNLFRIAGDVYHGLTTHQLLNYPDVDAEALTKFSASDEEAWNSFHTQEDEVSLGESTGQHLVYEVTKVPVYHSDGQRSGMIVIGKDVTAQRRTQEALRRSETVAAIGQLASGIAHEIRNPLAGIKWAVEVLRTHHPDSHAQVDLILNELDRVDGIVGELLMVAKPHQKQFGVINLRDVLQSVVLLMTGQARKQRIALVLDVPEGLPSVHCEPHQLKQVFLNLVKNAMEAMQDAGVIRLEAKVESGADGMPWMACRVLDDGCGMSDEVMKHLGQPFVTTKEKGTGLGIMVTQKIIQDHGGTLEFSKNTPAGTVVTVRLPLDATQK